jgi:LemA protein
MTSLLLLSILLPVLAGCCLAVSIWSYNALVRSRLLVREAFSGIDVQLKRRHDLIPNLVRVVRQYSQHEQQVLEEVVARRAAAMHAMAPETKLGTEASLNQALGGMLAIAESNPTLRADEHYLELMKQLSSIEDDLQKSRRYFNGTVRELNTRVESFPSNLFARLFGFHLEGFFTLERLSEANLPLVQLHGEHDNA